MYASLVIFPALVALAAGQYAFPFAFGGDTPEVAHAKSMHAAAHASAILRNAGYAYRVRRDVSNVDTPEMDPSAKPLHHQIETSPCACEGEGEGCQCSKRKRQLMGIMTVQPYGYTGMTSPLIYRIRRDADQDDAEFTRDRRQVMYSGNPYYYGYTALTSPVVYRIRRDDDQGDVETNKEKRQLLYSGSPYGYYGYSSPFYARSGLGYSAYYG
ncbi:unnamed protein product [Bemisia tabaci]|uniref:Uncharacterized protein n=1 Tax=Bemisia tabaci TaxID=7038 RepID=A0A9P0F286_BEMTA|nr:unnamed protein product [Bemisia tabaci]